MMKSSKEQGNSSSSPHLKLSVYWGDILYDTVICRPDASITVGTKPGSTFLLDLPSQKEALELIKVHRENFAELRFDHSVGGHVRFGTELMSLRSEDIAKHATAEPDGAYKLQLTTKDRADLVIGHVSFCLDWVTERNVIPAAKRNNRTTALVSAIAAICVLLITLLQYFAPQLVDEKPPERLVQILPPSWRMPRQAPAKAAVGERRTADGGAQKGESGKAHLVVPKKKESEAVAIKNAKLGNLVKNLANLGTEAPLGATSKHPTEGAPAAIAQTGTGFSTEGLKAGGGGKTVGIGRTLGQGAGGFEGTGRLGLAGNSRIEGSGGRGGAGSLTRGGLDRDVIDAIVRRRQDRIRLCYERQLNFFPRLSGKVAVQFVIGKDGQVVSDNISEDTMNNDNVRSCILSEVKNWTFPHPSGGTLVTVEYPFVFESSARSPAGLK